MNTNELLKILEENKDINIDKLLDNFKNLTFETYIETLRLKINISKSELIKKSTLDRNYAYQILNGTKVPSQDKVILLSLALELDLHDTNNLLTLSHNKVLYPKLKRDALIILCINNHYSIIKTNELLYQYNLGILK